MKVYRLTIKDCKVKDFSTFTFFWNNRVDFILNGLADFGDINHSNGYINKEEYIAMYNSVFKDKYIELITDSGNYVVSSNLLLSI